MGFLQNASVAITPEVISMFVVARSGFQAILLQADPAIEYKIKMHMWFLFCAFPGSWVFMNIGSSDIVKEIFIILPNSDK